jgi:hypothetical protein
MLAITGAASTMATAATARPDRVIETTELERARLELDTTSKACSELANEPGENFVGILVALLLFANLLDLARRSDLSSIGKPAPGAVEPSTDVRGLPAALVQD